MSTNQFLCLKKVHKKFFLLSVAPCRSQSLVWLRKKYKEILSKSRIAQAEMAKLKDDPFSMTICCIGQSQNDSYGPYGYKLVIPSTTVEIEDKH